MKEHDCKKPKHCKTCYNIEYYEKNKEKEKLRTAKYISEHEEQYKQLYKHYYEANKEVIRENRRKDYQKKGPDQSPERKLYQKQYREQNRKKLSELSKIWREQNREKIKEKHKKYQEKSGRELANIRARERKKVDKLYALECRMRCNFRTRLKKVSPGCFRHLSYSPIQLKEHLESKFQENMTWENMGLWHIDHIIPIKYRNELGEYYWDQKDLLNTKSEAFKQAWSLDNLKPEWANINVKKSNKYIG